MVECIDMFSGDYFTLYRGDCVEVILQLPDESIGFSVYSPPFASLYVYSDSERDMGNCETDEEFFTHYKFLVDQLYRLKARSISKCSLHESAIDYLQRWIHWHS